MTPQPRSRTWLVLALLVAAGAASYLAGRGGRPMAPSRIPGTPGASGAAAPIAPARATAQAAANGQLQLADAALETGDTALARGAVATAVALVGAHGLTGDTADLAAAFDRFMAAEDAAAGGDLAAARAAFGTAEARFAAAMAGGALPAVVEPTHLFSGAGIRFVDGQATLTAGDAAGALPLLREAESRRGPAYRPALETAAALAAGTPTP